MARPSAFLFFALTLVPCLILSGLRGLRGRSAFRCRLARFYVKPNRTLFALLFVVA